MMKWLTSLPSFVVQAILVIAAVLIFAFIDPFGIFLSTTLKLRDTPSHVKQIREIGELVTAEYYGEVISSYRSIVELETEIQIDQKKDEIKEFDSLFISKVSKLLFLDSEKEQKQQFEELLDEFKKFDLYQDYLKVIRNKLDIGVINILFNHLIKKEKVLLLKELDKSYLGPLYAQVKKEVEHRVKKNKVLRKSQLILVGRGRVQAGFSFDSLTERNVRVDTVHHRIILVGFVPKILSADINPWFIPELGIKGFEILDMNGKADNPAILKRVKQNCLDSLKIHALKSQILQKALENAESNLAQLFALLLDDPKIVVKITSDETDYYAKYVLAENAPRYLNISQLKTIDSLTNRFLSASNSQSGNTGPDSAKAFEWIDRLTSHKLQIELDTYSITR
jgi:hypothetical protein